MGGASMTPAPHPLRCETCDKPYCEGEETRFKFCPLAHHYVLMMWDGKYIPYTQTSQDIETLGCASHSASSDVLEELRKNVVKLYDDGFKNPLCTFDAAVSMMKYGDIKLRQQQTKER
jgi:hypothetical protein